MKPRLLALLIVVLGSFLGITAWRWVDEDPARPPQVLEEGENPTESVGADGAAPNGARTSEPSHETAQRLAYVVTRDGTGLRGEEAETSVPVAGGILLPLLAEHGDTYEVFDTCNRVGFLDAAEVDVGNVPIDRPETFGDSVFVIDPGHGGPDYGATGPTGLAETEVNLDVAARVVELLRSPRDVDRATGEVTPGTDIPAAAEAVLTRSPAGPEGGEYELGLTFRTTVANSLDATALVSIHHNSGPEMSLDHPGSEAFVSVSDPESPRLGGLIVEELRESLARFPADWMGSDGPGVFSRVNSDGEDYYSVLARSEVPAVIVEGAYISNPTEEELARTDEFRQAYAEAVYRALVRFVTTDDYPIPAPEPEPWNPNRPGPSVHDCVVPAQ